MKRELAEISLTNLSFMIIPVLLVLFIYRSWSLDAKTPIYGTIRMLVQLLLVGYVLTFIFISDNYLVISGVLCIMLTAASWIALRPLHEKTGQLFLISLMAIGVSGISILAMVTQLVLNVDPWYSPHTLIPLAGMIFAGSMNAVSLAGERLHAELTRGASPEQARGIAFGAALIPIVNTLFAVGLVSLPGMMTGQILSGVDPLIAARYQIMVMLMIFSSTGISAAIYLHFFQKYEIKQLAK